MQTLLSAHIFWLDSQVSPDYFGKFLGLDDLQAGKAEREADGIFKHCNVLKASEASDKTEKEGGCLFLPSILVACVRNQALP